MPNTREKLIELPIDDATLILKEELKQRIDGYTTYLANGGKGDPAEEVNLDALAMAISALEQTKWIPVTERLPESKEKVLVYGGRTEIWFNGTKQPMPSIHTGYLRGLGDGWFSWDYNDYICDVTNWMPLPEPPKGE